MSKKKNPKKGKVPAKATQPLKPAKSTEWFCNRRLLAGLLFCLGFLLYANSLGNQYALDDAIVITQNEFTQQGVDGYGGILKYDTFRGFFKVEGKEKLVAGGRYRPLTLLMFATEYELFGNNPFVGHLINCLLFGGTGALFFLFLFQLLSPKKGMVFATWVALGAALLFVAHPLHTEAVANIKGRDEIVAFLTGVVALYAMIKAWDSSSKAKWYIFSVLILFLGLLAKEHVITLTVVGVLALYYFRESTPAKALVGSWPLWLASLVFLIVRGRILGWEFGEPSMELMNNPFLVLDGNTYVAMPFGEKFATIFYTLGMYLKLLVIPHPLTHDYYPRHIEVMTFANPIVIISLLTHLGLLAAAIVSLGKKTIWGFSIWFYLLTLSIVSNIVFPVGTNMSERFLYLPSAGFCLAISALLYQLLDSAKAKKGISRFPKSIIALAVIAIIFGLLTILRNPVWKDDYTLFTTDVKVSERSAKLQTSAAGQMIERSQTLDNDESKRTMLLSAVAHLKKAIEIHPYFGNAHHLLGNANIYLGSYQEALTYYNQATAINPNFIEAVNNTGVAYLNLNQFAQAISQFDQALAINPNYTEAVRYKALTNLRAGQYYGEKQNDPVTAIRYLEEANKLKPNDFQTLRLLGVAYGTVKNNDQAILYFDQALPLAANNKDKATVLLNLGTAWYYKDQAKANDYYQQAGALDPSILQRQQAQPGQ